MRCSIHGPAGGRIVVFAALLAVASACNAPRFVDKGTRAPPPIEEDRFVEAHGGQLVVGGTPVRFAGVNGALVYGETVRAESARMLSSLDASELRVVRIWALGETDGDEAWRRESAFRIGPDGWVEESFAHLDQLLVDARAAGVRVILTLANRWRDHGGLPQYARWAGIPVRYTNLMPGEMRATLRSERVRELYLEHVRRLVGRTNQISGIPYADDPTIFAWELFNEVSAQTWGVQEALLSFLNRSAREVRELDPHHLIVPGHIGYNSVQSRRFWREIHQQPWVGYADTHGYPQNLLAATSPERFADWLGDRAGEARGMGRPLVVGEVGIPREWENREQWFATFFERAREEGVSAVLPWIARPYEEGRDDAHGIWFWGPNADESAILRAVFRQQSKRVNDLALLPLAPPESASFPLGVQTIAAFTQGEYTETELIAEPWAITEGNTHASTPAWLLYALDASRALGTMAHFEIRAMTPELQAAVPDAALRLSVNGTFVGRWTVGAFEHAEAAEDWTDKEVAWVRLDAENDAGSAVLRRFAQELPGPEHFAFRFANGVRPSADAAPE